MIQSTEIQANIKKTGTWKRILFMLLFAVILGLVRMLLWAVILLQVLSSLITGTANPNVLKLGRTLSAYVYRILLFLTYNSDELPFPFADWDGAEETQKTRSPGPKNSHRGTNQA
ncbi:MAG: DUF4389 domain-containing protein [Gammaproteobacteria bacterium]